MIKQVISIALVAFSSFCFATGGTADIQVDGVFTANHASAKGKCQPNNKGTQVRKGMQDLKTQAQNNCNSKGNSAAAASTSGGSGAGKVKFDRLNMKKYADQSAPKLSK